MASMDILHLVSLVSTVVAATWFLTARLGRIEAGLKSHVDVDEEKFKDLGGRVLKLERRWRR